MQAAETSHRSQVIAPKAKRVVQLYMGGAASHIDLLDFKPALEKHHGEESVMANLADIVGIVDMLGGDEKLASVNGDAFRSQMTQNITSAGTAGAGAMASRILAQFPNPAQFRVEQENVLQRAFARAP